MKFASRIVRKVIHDVLGNVPEFMGPINNQFHYGLNHPQTTRVPAALHYMEQNDYGEGAVNTANIDDVNRATFRWVVRVDDHGTTDGRIVGAAEAQLTTLHGLSVDTTDGEGRNVTVAFRATGEIPMPPYDDDNVRHQTLGSTYSVELTRGEY
jgi:hypothetical protein